jgi:hypothetical protein
VADGSALRDKYGTPERLADREADVLVFRHTCEESARAFAAANNEDGSHPSTVEELDGYWVTVVDLRPHLAQITESFRESCTVTINFPVKEASRG